MFQKRNLGMDELMDWKHSPCSAVEDHPVSLVIFELQCDKTSNLSFAYSKDTDQPEGTAVAQW